MADDLDIKIGQPAAPRAAGSDTSLTNQPARSDATLGVQAHGTNTENPLAGVGQAGDVLENQGIDQLKSAQNTWLMQAGTAADINAQQSFDQIQRQVQPGQPTLPLVQKALDTQKTDALNQTSDNPYLSEAYAQRIQMSHDAILKQSQDFDTKELDRSTQFNLGQGLQNMGRSIMQTSDYDQIKNNAEQYIGEFQTTLNNTNLTPAERDEWSLKGRSAIAMQANQQMQKTNPKQWVAENANLFPAQVGESIGVPLGIRNNNPGNIQAAAGTWAGQTATDPNGYAVFSTPEAGIRAAAVNIKNQQDLHGLQTVQDIMTKYAPPTDATGKPINDTPAYIADVSQKLGVAPTDKVNLHDPNVLAAFTGAVLHHENGGNPATNQTLQWAANAAINPSTAGAAPTSTRSDGGTLTSSSLTNVLLPEEQQKLASDYVTQVRQERTILADSRREATTLLQNLNQNMTKGIMPSDGEIEQVQEAAKASASPAINDQVQKLVDMQGTARKVSQMNPNQVNQYINDQQLMPQSLARDNAIAYAQTFQKKQQDILTKNPLGFYAMTGRQIPPVNFNDPTTFAARRVAANNLVQNYGADPAKSFLTPAESNELAQTYQNSPIDVQRKMLTGFAQNFGSDTGAASAGFAKIMPNFAYAASMLSNAPTQTPDNNIMNTALDITAGDRRIKEDKNKVIPIANIKTQMQNDGWDKVLSPQMYDSVLGASQAVYAARYAGHDMDSSKLSDIISEVAGGQKAQVGNQVVAPVGVNKDTFEAYAQNITAPKIQAGLASARQYMTGEEGPIDMAMPRNADGDFQPGKNKFVLRSIGPNLYEMMAQNGQPYMSPNSPGKRAILRISGDDISGPPVKAPAAAGQ